MTLCSFAVGRSRASTTSNGSWRQIKHKLRVGSISFTRNALMRPVTIDDACSMVCVSVLGTRVSCVKTVEPIDMAFGGQTRVDQRNLVLDGFQIPHGKGHFWEGYVLAIVMYVCVSALHIVRLPPCVIAEQKGNEVGRLLYHWPSLTWWK